MNENSKNQKKTSALLCLLCRLTVVFAHSLRRPRGRLDTRMTHTSAGTELPPGAAGGGSPKGAVTLALASLQWQLRGAPQWVRVTARWWGDEPAARAAGVGAGTGMAGNSTAHARKRPWVRLDADVGAVGPSRHCPPRHKMPLDSRNEGSTSDI